MSGTTFPRSRRAFASDPLPLLRIESPVSEIVAAYILHHVMPSDPLGDALHLALASYHKCDLLLTWDCRHLANANEFGHIRRVNTLLGIFVPALLPSNSLEQTMKKTDPGLEHVRQVRHEISAKLDHDPKRLVEHYEKLQEKYSDRIVRPATTDEAATEPRDR